MASLADLLVWCLLEKVFHLPHKYNYYYNYYNYYYNYYYYYYYYYFGIVVVVVFFISLSPGGYAIYRRNARVLEMQNFPPAYMKGWTYLRMHR